MTTSYVYIDRDNGGSPANATPDTATSKYHTTYGWPANGARWSGLEAAFNDATIIALTNDVEFWCIGSVADAITAGPLTMNNSYAGTSYKFIGDLAGAAWSTAKYRAEYTAATAASSLFLLGKTVSVPPVSFRSMQIRNAVANVGSASACIGNTAGAAAQTVTVRGCFLRSEGTGTGTTLTINAQTAVGHNYTVYNTVMVNECAASSTRYTFGGNALPTLVAYNCVAYGGGFVEVDTVTSCVVFNAADDFETCTNITYCASDDGDGTNALTGLTWTDQFENYAAYDFRLKANSSLIDAGFTDPGAGLFSDDIAGTPRPQGTAWGIGVWEYQNTVYVTTLPQRNVRHTGRFSG